MKDPILNPIHPGEILREDFLAPLGISQNRLAKDIHVPLRRINEVARQRRGIVRLKWCAFRAVKVRFPAVREMAVGYGTLTAAWRHVVGSKGEGTASP